MQKFVFKVKIKENFLKMEIKENLSDAEFIV